MDEYTMNDYIKYLQSISTAELLVRCEECEYARHHGGFEKDTGCAEMFNNLMNNGGGDRYLIVLLDMCMSTAFELMDRATFGTLSTEDYEKYVEDLYKRWRGW